MNEKFVTEGIQNDRYLKAIRLINRLEDEFQAELERIGDEIVADNPDLFSETVEASWNNGRSTSKMIAFARVDYPMTRVKSVEESSSKLKLNICLRWMDPADWGHQDVEGALFAASYRIKGSTQEDFERVKQETVAGDWNLEVGAGKFRNSPGAFYIPVDTAAGLRDAHETLKEHFSEYGHLYGFDPQELPSDESTVPS